MRHDWDSLSATLAELMQADPAGCRPTVLAFTAERHSDLRAGLWALGYVVTPDDFEVLAGALCDEDPRVRGVALGAMSSLRDDPRVLPALLAVVPDPDQEVRASEAAVETLLELLTDEDVMVREAAVRGLGVIGGRMAVDALIALAGHPDPRIRAEVAAALGAQVGPDTVATLRILARDEAPQVRVDLVTALGQPGVPEAVPLVVALAADPDPDVRTRAAVAIGRLDDAASLDTLRRLAEADPEPRVRSIAATVLGRQRK